MQYNLLFERFLNPERISMPDIDIDFADRGRDKIIDYVVQKYGKDNVCQIITFGTMAARAAIRDVGRGLGYSYEFCDRIAILDVNTGFFLEAYFAAAGIGATRETSLTSMNTSVPGTLLGPVMQGPRPGRKRRLSLESESYTLSRRLRATIIVGDCLQGGER